MAKVADIIKKIFGDSYEKDVDEFINDKKEKLSDDTGENDDKTGKEKKDSTGGKDKVTGSNENKDKDNGGVEGMDEENKVVKIIEDGCYDEATGKVDISKIKDPAVADLITKLMIKDAAKQESNAIEEALKTGFAKYKLNVKPETINKLVDRTGIKYVDGKVYGVEEAIESLKKSDAALFIDKKKESSPLNEGFSPVTKPSSGDSVTFEEAFSSVLGDN